MTPPPETEKPLGQIVSEATEKASLLVREEIELAKAEITSKVKTLGRGAGVAVAAGVFLFFAFIFFLHALAYFFQDLFDSSVWLGYLLVVIILVVFAVISGLLAKKWLSTGAPTPDMAIQEARVTKEELEQVAAETPKLEEKT